MSIREEIAAQLALDRRREQGQVLWDLYEFATEYLGYDKLSEKFHRPMLQEWDRIDRMRLVTGRQLDTLDLWPRDHIKTWCERARVIRAYLVRPDLTVTWWHAVEEMAQESAVAVAKQLQFNRKLRKLAPDGMLPSENMKRFVGATGFSLKSNKIGDAPSMRAWGAGSEATGGHSVLGVLDDPIGFNDVLDNQFGAKRRWYQATVRNVVRSDGWIDAIGTRWDREDMYGDWLENRNWKARLRACLETDGVPDYNGEPVYLTKQQIERKRLELGPVMFAYQMMNDVTQAESRPWQPDTCEQFISEQDAMKGPGFWVLLMDPAAANVGDEDWQNEKARADGTKNYWAMQVWKVRRNGQKVERILMDARSSKEWGMDQGMQEACVLLRRWAPMVHHVGIEDTSPFMYIGTFKRVASRMGIHGTVIQLSPRGQSKNVRWGSFCGRALSGEVFICKDTVPESQTERLLDQARRWVPRGKSNGLRFDDEADCAAYIVDPEVEVFVPKVRYQEEPLEWSPYKDKVADSVPTGGSLYVRW